MSGDDLTKTIRERYPDEYGDPPEDIQKALGIFDLVAPRALRQPDVVGVDIGYMIKEKSGAFEDVVGIRFHVATKLPTAQLQQLGRVDLKKMADLEKLFRGVKVAQKSDQARFTLAPEKYPDRTVPIDVVEGQFSPSHYAAGSIRSRRPRASIELTDAELDASATIRVEPLVGGVSIGSGSGSAGSLGLVVHDRTDGRPCILSNWHVLAGFGVTQRGRPCFQPSLFDGGGSGDQVGRLKRWVFDRTADAALAELDGSRHYAAGSILGLFSPINGILEPWLGMKVLKRGRSTGLTQGFIDGVHMSADIPYGPVTPRRFDGQLHIAPRFSDEIFSDPGDSGSLVVTEFPVMRPTNATQGLTAANLEFEQLKSSEFDIAAMPTTAEDLLNGKKAQARLNDLAAERSPLRVYLAVGLLFAGDTAGSGFGEFALATPMAYLAESLQFSIHPVFVPENDLVPQVGLGYGATAPAAADGGGRPPRQIGVGAGAQPGLGGAQPEPEPIPPDDGP